MDIHASNSLLPTQLLPAVEPRSPLAPPSSLWGLHSHHCQVQANSSGRVPETAPTGKSGVLSPPPPAPSPPLFGLCDSVTSCPDSLSPAGIASGRSAGPWLQAPGLSPEGSAGSAASDVTVHRGVPAPVSAASFLARRSPSGSQMATAAFTGFSLGPCGWAPCLGKMFFLLYTQARRLFIRKEPQQALPLVFPQTEIIACHPAPGILLGPALLGGLCLL